MRKQFMPPNFKDWCNKVERGQMALISYTDKINLSKKIINMSEIFEQMSTEGKLNSLYAILDKCLDENERSLFFSDISEKYGG